MARHEIPDDQDNPQIPPFPESLRRRLEQQASGETPVYRIGSDGTGHLETPSEATAPSADVGGDLAPLLDGIDKLSRQLADAINSTPDIHDDGKVNAEMFDLSTRLAIIHAGNALDYAVRRVEDISRTRRIMKLRSELAHEMKAAGLTGDPHDGMTPG